MSMQNLEEGLAQALPMLSKMCAALDELLNSSNGADFDPDPFVAALDEGLEYLVEHGHITNRAELYYSMDINQRSLALATSVTWSVKGHAVSCFDYREDLTSLWTVDGNAVSEGYLPVWKAITLVAAAVGIAS